jgi:hypothetical protein
VFLAGLMAINALGLNCVGNIQRELSVLYEPGGELGLIRQSVLVDLFGLDIIRPLFG